MLHSALTAVAAAVTITAVSTLCMYLAACWRARALRRMNPTMTVYAVLIPPRSVLTILNLIPPWMKIMFPPNWTFHGKYDRFKDTTDGVFAVCTMDQTNIQVANPELSKEIMVNRYKEFLKPIHLYGSLDAFGKNVLTTERDEWRRHRKIAAPTFSEQNNALVHESSITIAQGMFAAWDKNSVTSSNGTQCSRVDVASDMMEFALSVISSAAFGIDIPWHTEPDHSEFRQGFQISFRQALEIVVNQIQIWIVIPKILFLLPIKYLQDMKKGFDEFEKYLDRIIDDAEGSASVEKPKNLLQMLVKATLAEKSPESRLSKSELKGNSFIFIFAGHETTGGVLHFALTLLALHPKKQQKLYDEIRQVLGNASAPEYKDLAKLKYALSVMNETMRLFPPVTGIPKYTATQTLALGPYVLPARTYVSINTPGLHYNPAAWGGDLFEFKPERFMASDAASTGFAPFSEGPRGCVGKKFAQVEFVTLLTLISLKYTWKLPEGVDADRALDTRHVITLKPKNPVEIIFTPR
ncbi:hypothetical protein CcCBS67573_g05207 [Chytriomyces confervae]|uniref:Cytochrome P450 n=1 Tax=Chytriomyces confervae TaxID=246404 RepID=A0A507FD78_9FUNG|nr:hypothetical protein CcCBS67573_g05207 [Chytriomyces confervae]